MKYPHRELSDKLSAVQWAVQSNSREEAGPVMEELCAAAWLYSTPASDPGTRPSRALSPFWIPVLSPLR